LREIPSVVICVAIDVVVLLDNCVDFWDERMTSEEFDDLVARSADY